MRDSFARYLPANSASTAVVLDPFCGVGTTLIEAMRCGHAAIGFEVNPYAALATRAKCEAAALSPSQVNACIRKFEEYMRQPLGDAGSAAAPEHFRSRIPFFGPRARAKVLKALGFIRRLPVSPVQDLFSIAFGSVMVSLSNYSYEPSLGTRPAAGRPLQHDAPVAESIVTKLLAMNSDVAWFREELGRFASRPQGRVIPDSFLDALQHLEPASVDLLVTSPPYLNNYHYVRNTRPQLFWLGLVSRPGELKRLERQNFGKYWQTVRELESVPLDFEHPGLEGLLAQLRLVGVERGSYGGRGWANYAASYFNDTNRFCHVASRLLKPQARAVVVVGNSILQGVEIPIDHILAGLASRHGLLVESLHVVRQKRVGASIVASSVRQGARTTARLYESAVVLRRA
ncbi:MAG TPA: DNA methyltransferase [Dongiaceae bacterium]|nr:DNA methyltransferase [Dongiaceae bacterium]